MNSYPSSFHAFSDKNRSEEQKRLHLYLQKIQLLMQRTNAVLFETFLETTIAYKKSTQLIPVETIRTIHVYDPGVSSSRKRPRAIYDETFESFSRLK
ncbi:hypothetical protein CDAR_622471 [Caerostris darwini]|uniref:Uncharacterized protein n=1 Tax=Caerostris darwini TaxID=1538125 RepID=A0AAV4N9E8_9ARAC|nr:hypothetical protein CDAR_622471 [Caerostris darwini]